MRPCLDKGFVEFMSASPDRKTMEYVVDSMKRGRIPTGLTRMVSVCMKIKAPLFVTMAMGRMLTITDDTYEPEVYVTKVDDIRSPDIGIAKDISDSINLTVEAGAVNRSTYTEDGCNKFVSTFTSTISAYWLGLAMADLQTWIDFSNEKHAPHHINVYQKAVQEVLVAEFPRLDDFLRRGR